MRDQERIDRIVEKLKRLWHKVPDQRLGQLIDNYVISTGRMRYQEDDETEAYLDGVLSSNRGKP